MISGLIPALRSLTHDFQKRSGIVTRFKGDFEESPLHKFAEVKMTLYRIAQKPSTTSKNIHKLPGPK